MCWKCYGEGLALGVWPRTPHEWRFGSHCGCASPEDSFDGKTWVEMVPVGHEEPGEKGRGLQGVLGSRQESGCKSGQYLEELRLGLFVSKCSYVSRWVGVVTRHDRDWGGKKDGCSRYHTNPA